MRGVVLEEAFKEACERLSNKKQTELIASYVYDKYFVFKKFKPLAIGIDQILIKELSQFNEKLVLRFLSNHCKTMKYKKSMAHGGDRYELKGKKKGIITEEQKQHALSELASLSQKI